jgi:hypothetical protein
MKILQVSLIYSKDPPKMGVSLVKISDGLEIYDLKKDLLTKIVKMLAGPFPF